MIGKTALMPFLKVMCISEESMLLDTPNEGSYKNLQLISEDEIWTISVVLHTGVVQIHDLVSSNSRVAVEMRLYQVNSVEHAPLITRISVPKKLRTGAVSWSYREALKCCINTTRNIYFTLELLRLDTCESLGVTPKLFASKYNDDHPHRLELHRSGATLTFSVSFKQGFDYSFTTIVPSLSTTRLVEACHLQQQTQHQDSFLFSYNWFNTGKKIHNFLCSDSIQTS